MSPIEVKKDPWVIVPYTIFTVVAFVLFGLQRIDWTQLLGLLAALNLPSVFGLWKAKPGESAPDSSDDDDAAPPKSATTRIPPPLSGLVFFVVPSILVFRFLACAPAMTPAEKRAAAEGTFTAALAACVEKSETRAEADACADRVREEWAAKDGGR